MADERFEIERVLPPDDSALGRRGYARGGYYAEGYGLGYDDEHNADHGTNTLTVLWRAVRRRKWWIAAITVIITTFAIIEASRVKPMYSSYSVVEIRKDTSMLGGPNGDVDPENLVSINTKMLVFSSRSFLEDIVAKLNLDQNKKFLDVSLKRSWWETLKSFGRRGAAKDEAASSNNPAQGQVQSAASTPDQTKAADGKVTNDKSANQADQYFESLTTSNPRLDYAIAILERNLNISHIRDTQALKITFTHTDPIISAAVTKCVAENFVHVNFENKIEKFTNTSNWLERSTRDLLEKVKDSEQSLANYTRDHGIYPLDGQQSLTSNKLMRLHEQCMRSDTELLLKKSIFEEVKLGHAAQLPEAFADAKTAELQKKINELSVTVAQLAASYGPENPRVTEVQIQMVKLQEQLDASRRSLEEKLKMDYDRAGRDNEAMKAALNQAKTEAVEQDQAAIQYHILKQNVDTAKLLYTEFLQKTNQANLEVAQQRNNVSIIQPAKLPKSPDGPTQGLTVLLASLLSLTGSAGLAFLLENFDRTIKNVADVNRFTQLPTLGVIPSVTGRKDRRFIQKENKQSKNKQISITANGSTDGLPYESSVYNLRFLPSSRGGKRSRGHSSNNGELVTTFDQWSSIAEAYRAIRTSVLLSNTGTPPKTILITSSQPGEGKTTTVINTAISLAQLGASVLIIDADLRKPSTHKGFGVRRGRGLSTCLKDGLGTEGMIQKLSIPNLSLLPCGPIPPNPAELISSERMKGLLKQLAERYNHILIDSPPLMYVTDPVILSTLVDGVILVVHGGKSTRDVVCQSRTMLTTVGAKIFGVVLNKVDLRHQSRSDFAYYPYSENNKERDEEGVSDILL